MMTEESEIVVQASPGLGWNPINNNQHQQCQMQMNQQQQFQQWQQQQEFQRFLMSQQSQNPYQTPSQYQPPMAAMHNSNNAALTQDQAQFQEFLQWKQVQQQQQQQQQTSDNSIAAPAPTSTATTGTTPTSTSKSTSSGGGCARSALESGCGVFTVIDTATSTMNKVNSQQEKLSSSFGQMQSAWEKTRGVFGSCAGVVEKFV